MTRSATCTRARASGAKRERKPQNGGLIRIATPRQHGSYQAAGSCQLARRTGHSVGCGPTYCAAAAALRRRRGCSCALALDNMIITADAREPTNSCSWVSSRWVVERSVRTCATTTAARGQVMLRTVLVAGLIGHSAAFAPPASLALRERATSPAACGCVHTLHPSHASARPRTRGRARDARG